MTRDAQVDKVRRDAVRRYLLTFPPEDREILRTACVRAVAAMMARAVVTIEDAWNTWDYPDDMIWLLQRIGGASAEIPHVTPQATDRDTARELRRNMPVPFPRLLERGRRNARRRLRRRKGGKAR